MTHRKFLSVFPWSRYSRKLSQKIERPRHVGVFTVGDAEERGMFRAVGGEGELQEGNRILLFWLVDPIDGVIADVKFQVFGPSVLIGAAEAVCDLLIRKNYDQASKLTGEEIDRSLRDRPSLPAFPAEHSGYLNLVLEAIRNAAESCQHLPLASNYVPTPLRDDPSQGARPYPGWKGLSLEQKLAVIEQVIAEEIRPYIELDAGGIQILSLVEDRELTIAYEGACTSCYSATGATLDAIQRILRLRVDPDLVVIPDRSFLQI